jgi:hypothetical protein
MAQHRARRDAVDRALLLRGCFSATDGDALETSVAQLREKWR